MENYENLLDIINRKDEDIVEYLDTVHAGQFRKDVLALSKMNVDKQLLSELILKLQELL